MEFGGYKVVREVISREMAHFLTSTILLAEKQGKTRLDEQVPGSSVVHGHEASESLMLMLLPKMQAETGLELIPTYSYTRIYRKGDELTKHIDRPACEISTTLTLGFIVDKLWPIFVEDEGEKSFHLDSGDMLIYRGCDIPHWRDPFPGDLWVQVFLHYVDAHGPHADHALDKRPISELYETIYSTFFAPRS